MFYRYFYELGSHSELFSPRWPPLIFWLHKNETVEARSSYFLDQQFCRFISELSNGYLRFNFRFHTITTAYYRGALGIMLVYDVTNENTFQNISKWMRRIEDHANEDVDRILVANKCDLESARLITRESGELLARNYGIQHVETSALSSENVEQAFILLTEQILNRVCPPVQEEATKTAKGKKKRVKLKKSDSSHGKPCCSR